MTNRQKPVALILASLVGWVLLTVVASAISQGLAQVVLLFGLLVTLALLCALPIRALIRWNRARTAPYAVYVFGASSKFAEAIGARLPAGETVVGFAPCYTAVSLPGSTWDFNFYGLALTTVGLRLAQFGEVKERTGRVSSVRRYNDRVTGETLLRMSEITKVRSEEKLSPEATAVARRFIDGFGASLPDVNRTNRLPVTGLTWTTVDGHSTTVWSPFVELDTLIENLNRLRAGDFLAARANTSTDAVERLRRMVDDGLLTEDEFNRLKGGFVGSTIERQETVDGRIRQMHQLMRDGILTESEFRQKKWDLLSQPG